MGRGGGEAAALALSRGAAVPETEPPPSGTAAHAALGHPPLVLHCQAPSNGGGKQHFAFSNLLIPMPMPRSDRAKQKPSGKEPER